MAYSDINLINPVPSFGPLQPLGALNATIQIQLAGKQGAGLALAVGTLAATLTPEISVDGLTWVASRFIDVTGTETSTLVLTNPNAASQVSIVVLGGVQQVRVRVSSYTSGTANATLVATAAWSQQASSGGGGSTAVVGTLTNNNAAPAATNVGVLPAVANAAAPTFTEGDQVLLSVDLSGGLRTSGGGGTTTVAGAKTNNNAAPGATNIGALVGIANAAAPTYIEGDQVLVSTDLAGATRVTGTVAATQSGTWTVQPGNTANTTAWLVKQVRSTTPAQSSVAGSATSVPLLASNANRLGATIFNDSSAILYMKLGATASTTSYTSQLASNAYYEVPFNYTGAIDGIWASATGNARITELT